MLTLSPAKERGQTRIDWLESHHTFSFGEWYDPQHMGFRALRVINDDRVAAGRGFPTHGHADMEILSYVLEGALEHKDSIGTGSVIRPGDVQRMSAGTGVRHSEFNGSESEPVHFLQIWITPDKAGQPPSYEEKKFSDADKRGQLRLVASSDGRDGSLSIHQDASLYAGLFDAGEQAKLELLPGRCAWVHVAKGSLNVNGELLKAGDAAAIEKTSAVELSGVDGAEVLVFDLS